MYQLIKAVKHINKKPYNLELIIESEKKKVFGRAKKVKLYVNETEDFAQNPEDVATLQATIAEKKVRILNGDIKEVTYLLLFLGLPLTNINRIKKPYPTQTINKLLTAIKQKIKDINNTQKTRQGSTIKTIAPAIKKVTDIEEKLQTINLFPTAKTSTKTIEKVEKQKKPEKKIEKPEVTEEKTQVKAQVKKQTQATQNKINIINIAQNALPDITKVITDYSILGKQNNQEDQQSKAIQKNITTLQKIKQQVLQSIENNDSIELQQLLPQAMEQMELIELSQLQQTQKETTNKVSQELHQDIELVKEYEQRKDQNNNGSVKSFFQKRSREHIKKQVGSIDKFLISLQYRLKRIGIFITLNIGISTSLSLAKSSEGAISTASNTLSKLHHLPQRGIIGLAIIIRSRTQKKSVAVKIGSAALLILTTIISLRMM